MRRDPAARPITWLLALFFLFLIDLGLTRTSLLWGPTAFENSGGLRTVFPQTYQVLRKIYAPAGDPEHRVVLLGNSRLALSIEGRGVERAIAEQSPKADIAVANLAIFGSYIGDMAVLARHLDVMDPDLTILTLGGPELARAPTNPDAAGPTRLLNIGWKEGPVPAASFVETLDRWARTAWPLFRFREFVREALLDRILGRPDPGPPPASFANRKEIFQHLYGQRADQVHVAHTAFLSQRTLESFTSFVSTAGPEHLRRQRDRVKRMRPITFDSESVVVLDQLIGELASSRRRLAILLMPENPVLDLDVSHELHRPAILERGAQIVKELGHRYDIAVIDGRRWLPADCFLDFHHPLFEPHNFEERLAKEILNAFDID